MGRNRILLGRIDQDRYGDAVPTPETDCSPYHHPTTIQSTVQALSAQTISSFRSSMRWVVRTAPMGVAKA
jgi:hypothetical protein